MEWLVLSLDNYPAKKERVLVRDKKGYIQIAKLVDRDYGTVFVNAETGITICTVEGYMRWEYPGELETIENNQVTHWKYLD